MNTIAILGPTASGKTSLGIELAKRHNANILSLDSLSIYKEIDIASAKPTCKEMSEIKHFGINVLHVSDIFNVTLFFDLYKEAKKQSDLNGKNLIILGGTGFYLKAMLDGMSNKPTITEKTRMAVSEQIKNLAHAYTLLCEVDGQSAKTIKSNDSYRIEKWLEIYMQTGIAPSLYFNENKRTPLIESINLFEIDIEKEILRDRISQRTEIMLKDGLIDEVAYLERKYTRAPNPMRAIGIKETLSFLDGELSKRELKERIIINTSKLAKRQRTFNKYQFDSHISANVENLKVIISQYYMKDTLTL